MKRSVFAFVGITLSGWLFQSLALGDEFRFPGGDPAAGKAAFVTLNCNQCHTVFGTDLEEPKGKRRLNLPLAAEKRFVESYGDIITAITNPQHVVAEQYKEILSQSEQAGGIKAFMPDMTHDMSARQLMDLVAFLHDAYSKQLKGYTGK